MYERKTIIKNLLKKYNKTYISVVENLDKEKAGCVSSCNFKVYFDVVEDLILIKDTITKENISIYYEFMNNDDLIKYKSIIDEILVYRKDFINEKLFSTIDSRIKGGYSFTDIGAYRIKQTIFEVKDTLKPINEYIAEIKKSEQYIALMSKKQ